MENFVSENLFLENKKTRLCSPVEVYRKGRAWGTISPPSTLLITGLNVVVVELDFNSLEPFMLRNEGVQKNYCY